MKVHNSTFADVLERLAVEEKTGAGEFPSAWAPLLDGVPSNHFLLFTYTNLRRS